MKRTRSPGRNQQRAPWWGLVVAALVFAPRVVLAQSTGMVVGTVTDRASGAPVGAARVQVGTSTLGAASDERGRFFIRNVPVGQQVLRLTRIGFRPENQTVNVTANDTTRVTFSLGQSAIELAQVVVTGTGGAVEKKKLGSSLGTVAVADIQSQIPTTNLSQVLSSKVAGLRSVGVGGGVGSGQDLRIRGMSSFNLNQRPAIYIDGVRVDTKGTEWAIGTIACCSFTGGNSTDRLSDLNPNDIERVEILKGAAAATLYGSEATNGVIQIFTKRGRGEGAVQWNMGLSSGFNRLRENLPTKEFPRFTGTDGTRARDANELIESGAYYGLDLSAGGGTPRMTYFASGALSNEEGSIQPNDQLKGNLRLNLTLLPSDKITIDTRSAYTRNRVNELQAGNNWVALLGNAMNGDPRKATKERPFGEAWVPVTDIRQITTMSDADRWTGGITASLAPISTFTHRATFGLDAVNESKSRFFPFAGAYGPAGVTRGQRNLGVRTYRVYTFDYLGQLAFKLPAEIGSDLSFGVQGFWETDRQNMATGNTFPGPGVSTVTSAAVTNGAEAFAETVNAGFLAQNRFSWKDRLFTTIGLRVDGNSAFGQDFGFQQYPKVELSYVLSEHAFLPNWISSMKLRGAVGKAGKMPGPFDSFLTFEARPVFESDASVVPSNPGNTDLRPETTTEQEFGLEAGLFSDRIGIDASWYQSVTKDAIFGVFNAPSSGFNDDRQVNVGKIRNIGWEASITYLAYQRAKMDWTVNLKLDGNKNEVRDLGGVTTGTNNVRKNYPVRGVWSRKATGFSVVNGKPETTRSDTVVYWGPPLPTFNASLGSTFRWGPVQFYGLVSMEDGAVFSNGDRPYRIRQGGADELLELLGPNGEATFASDSLLQYYTILDAIDSRDNVRVREVSITYQIPERFSSMFRVGQSSISLSGQNLMWWDDCHCVDPNMNWAGADSFGVGSGFLAQPSPRQYRLQIRTRF
jgi:TonB-dependent starch-binding outer membrane protein SusC